MAERVNRRVLKGRIVRRPREPRPHGVPFTPVPGQLELFEHSQHEGCGTLLCPCGTSS